MSEQPNPFRPDNEYGSTRFSSGDELHFQLGRDNLMPVDELAARREAHATAASTSENDTAELPPKGVELATLQIRNIMIARREAQDNGERQLAA